MLRHKLYRTENGAQINVFAGKHAQAPPLEWRLVSKQIEAACFIRLRVKNYGLFRLSVSQFQIQAPYSWRPFYKFLDALLALQITFVKRAERIQIPDCKGIPLFFI